MKRLLSGVLIAGFAAFSMLPAAAAATKVVTFKAASMKITGPALSGSCWTSSIASQRPDAFRCMVGNTIYDPCFLKNKHTVVCPQNIAANTGVTIKLTKKLPTANSGGASRPFMMQLSGGAKCNVGTGTVVPGYPYYCSGNLVCSTPVRSGGTYQVTCGTSSNGLKVGALRKLAVAIFWR